MAATGSFITPRCAGANLVIRLLKEGAALPTTWAVLIGIIYCLFVSACLQFSVEFTVETADTPKTPVTTGEGTMLVGMLSLWFYAFVRRNGRWIWEPVNWGLGREGVEGMCVSCACVDWHYYLPQGVIAYSCAAVRCTYFSCSSSVCFLWLAERSWRGR